MERASPLYRCNFSPEAIRHHLDAITRDIPGPAIATQHRARLTSATKNG